MNDYINLNSKLSGRAIRQYNRRMSQERATRSHEQIFGGAVQKDQKQLCKKNGSHHTWRSHSLPRHADRTSRLGTRAERVSRPRAQQSGEEILIRTCFI